MAATSVSEAPREAAMVSSIGATTKRSKLLKKAANCSSRGPPDDSVGTGAFVLSDSTIRETPLLPHLTRTARKVAPADPIAASAPHYPSCKPQHEGGDDGYHGRQGVEAGRDR